MRWYYLKQYIHLTSNNQKLGSAFNDLDPKLVMMSFTPAKSAGDARYTSQELFIHSLIDCPIQSRLQSVLGVRSLYVERNKASLPHSRS